MNKSLKSSAKAIAVAALFTAAAGGYALAADMPVKAPPPAKPVPFFFVNDTSVSFVYYPGATDPGVGKNAGSVFGGTVTGGKNTFARYQGAIDHFDVWEYGTNLIHVEFNQYGDEDPALGQAGAQGSREFFGFSRSTIGLNELTHSKMFTNFLFTDVGVEVGGTAGVQDNYLDEHTTQAVAGLNFNLALPGTVLVSILAYKEYSRNEFNSCGATPSLNATCSLGGIYGGDRAFEATWKVESFIAEPLKFLPESIPVTFVNILNFTGPKGTGFTSANLASANGGAISAGTLANAETKVEIFEDARLSLDTSKVFWGKPGIWDTYVGYRYWYNKFGTDHNAPLFSGSQGYGAPGTSIESTVYVGSTYHFK